MKHTRIKFEDQIKHVAVGRAVARPGGEEGEEVEVVTLILTAENDRETTATLEPDRALYIAALLQKAVEVMQADARAAQAQARAIMKENKNG